MKEKKNIPFVTLLQDGLPAASEMLKCKGIKQTLHIQHLKDKFPT